MREGWDDLDEGRVLNREQGLHVSLLMTQTWGCSGGGGAHQAQVGLLRKQVLSIYNPNTQELTTVIPGNLLSVRHRDVHRVDRGAVEV